MKSISLFSSLLLLLFFIVSCSSNKSFYKEIDKLINKKQPTSFNGSILISQNGKIKYSKSHGFKKYGYNDSLSMNSQYEIMSNTKQITSVLILKEVEKGRIDLNADMYKYLDSLIKPWNDTVKVLNLLNHSHGIKDITVGSKLEFKPGSDFKYGNLSNILLGEILEKVTKKTYSELAHDLFKELKMNNTFCFSKNDRKNLVFGHMNKNNNYTVVENSIINNHNLAADGVISTVEDLAIWNDNLHNGKILKPETYKLMTTSSIMSQHDVFGKEKMGYGYNIRIISDSGIKYLGHTGLGDGFSSLNIYIPKYKLSLVIVENQMNEDSNLYYYYEKLIKDMLIKELKNKNFR